MKAVEYIEKAKALQRQYLDHFLLGEKEAMHQVMVDAILDNAHTKYDGRLCDLCHQDFERYARIIYESTKEAVR